MIRFVSDEPYDQEAETDRGEGDSVRGVGESVEAPVNEPVIDCDHFVTVRVDDTSLDHVGDRDFGGNAELDAEYERVANGS